MTVNQSNTNENTDVSSSNFTPSLQIELETEYEKGREEIFLKNDKEYININMDKPDDSASFPNYLLPPGRYRHGISNQYYGQNLYPMPQVPPKVFKDVEPWFLPPPKPITIPHSVASLLARADPVQIITDPVQNEIDLVQNKVDSGPVESDTDPVESDTDPVESDIDPGQYEIHPVQKDVDHVHNTVDHVESDVDSGPALVNNEAKENYAMDIQEQFKDQYEESQPAYLTVKTVQKLMASHPPSPNSSVCPISTANCPISAFETSTTNSKTAYASNSYCNTDPAHPIKSGLEDKINMGNAGETAFSGPPQIPNPYFMPNPYFVHNPYFMPNVYHYENRTVPKADFNKDAFSYYSHFPFPSSGLTSSSQDVCQDMSLGQSHVQANINVGNKQVATTDSSKSVHPTSHRTVESLVKESISEKSATGAAIKKYLSMPLESLHPMVNPNLYKGTDLLYSEVQAQRNAEKITIDTESSENSLVSSNYSSSLQTIRPNSKLNPLKQPNLYNSTISSQFLVQETGNDETNSAKTTEHLLLSNKSSAFLPNLYYSNHPAYFESYKNRNVDKNVTSTNENLFPNIFPTTKPISMSNPNLYPSTQKNLYNQNQKAENLNNFTQIASKNNRFPSQPDLCNNSPLTHFDAKKEENFSNYAAQTSSSKNNRFISQPNLYENNRLTQSDAFKSENLNNSYLSNPNLYNNSCPIQFDTHKPKNLNSFTTQTASFTDNRFLRQPNSYDISRLTQFDAKKEESFNNYADQTSSSQNNRFISQPNLYENKHLTQFDAFKSDYLNKSDNSSDNRYLSQPNVYCNNLLKQFDVQKPDNLNNNAETASSKDNRFLSQPNLYEFNPPEQFHAKKPENVNINMNHTANSMYKPFLSQPNLCEYNLTQFDAQKQENVINNVVSSEYNPLSNMNLYSSNQPNFFHSTYVIQNEIQEKKIPANNKVITAIPETLLPSNRSISSPNLNLHPPTQPNDNTYFAEINSYKKRDAASTFTSELSTNNLSSVSYSKSYLNLYSSQPNLYNTQEVQKDVNVDKNSANLYGSNNVVSFNNNHFLQSNYSNDNIHETQFEVQEKINIEKNVINSNSPIVPIENSCFFPIDQSHSHHNSHFGQSQTEERKTTVKGGVESVNTSENLFTSNSTSPEQFSTSRPPSNSNLFNNSPIDQFEIQENVDKNQTVSTTVNFLQNNSPNSMQSNLNENSCQRTNSKKRFFRSNSSSSESISNSHSILYPTSYYDLQAEINFEEDVMQITSTVPSPDLIQCDVQEKINIIESRIRKKMSVQASGSNSTNLDLKQKNHTDETAGKVSSTTKSSTTIQLQENRQKDVRKTSVEESSNTEISSQKFPQKKSNPKVVIKENCLLKSASSTINSVQSQAKAPNNSATTFAKPRSMPSLLDDTDYSITYPINIQNNNNVDHSPKKTVIEECRQIDLTRDSPPLIMPKPIPLPRQARRKTKENNSHKLKNNEKDKKLSSFKDIPGNVEYFPGFPKPHCLCDPYPMHGFMYPPWQSNCNFPPFYSFYNPMQYNGFPTPYPYYPNQSKSDHPNCKNDYNMMSQPTFSTFVKDPVQSKACQQNITINNNVVQPKSSGIIDVNVYQENPEGKSEKKPEGKSEKKPEGKSEKKPEGKSEKKPEGKSQETEIPEEKEEENPEENADENSQNGPLVNGTFLENNELESNDLESVNSLQPNRQGRVSPVMCFVIENIGDSYGIKEIPDVREKRRGRVSPFTHRQLKWLDNLFKETRHPDSNQIMKLCKEHGLDEKKVKTWFGNQRNRARKRCKRDNID